MSIKTEKKEAIMQKLEEYCRNGHTPLSLQRLIKEDPLLFDLTAAELIWFEKYVHRIKQIVNSKPGRQTLYAFKNGNTHTSYSIMQIYGALSHASFADWLKKLEEIKILCRFDQDDDLTEWGKKKMYMVNPEYKTVAKMVLGVIQRTNAPTI